MSGLHQFRLVFLLLVVLSLSRYVAGVGRGRSRVLLRGPVDGGVQGVLDLGVGALGVEVHGPREVHKGQVSVVQLVVDLFGESNS